MHDVIITILIFLFVWQLIVEFPFSAVILIIIFGLVKFLKSFLEPDNLVTTSPQSLGSDTSKTNKTLKKSSSLPEPHSQKTPLDKTNQITKDIEKNGALIIDKPWIDLILSGKKVWEMRTTKFKKVGYIGLIAKGTKTIVGIAKIQGFEGPLNIEQLENNIDKHHIPKKQFTAPTYKWFVAMKLTNVHGFPKPIPYEHKSGSVIWVKLSEQPEVMTQIFKALNSKKQSNSKPRKADFNNRKKTNSNVFSAKETKQAMRSLLADKNNSPGTAYRLPLSTTGKSLSDAYCTKDGLYHMKFDSIEYRFESIASLLSALRKLESAQWASFNIRGSRSWQTTKSWII